jgi:hypothetical protein
MWRYAIGRGDDDPARAAFVSEAHAQARGVHRPRELPAHLL